ncbi:MAG: hypothetical protein LC800_16525 [Acidobacteria bacterium]|nr:hypothetical protein [Acidobacteriota bacterium]
MRGRGRHAADDSAALQAAFDALAAAGGGTLDVPEGRYRLGSPVSKNFLSQASVIIRGHGSATVFRFASGPGTTNVSVQGAESLLVENMTFAGTPGVATDARIAFNVGSVDSHFGFASQNPRNAIEFFGVGTAVVDQTELRDKANRIQVDSLTKSLIISRSTVETLDADAAAITLEDSNIAALQLSPSSKVTTRSGGKLTAPALALGGGAELTTTNRTGPGNLVLANARL